MGESRERADHHHRHHRSAALRVVRECSGGVKLTGLTEYAGVEALSVDNLDSRCLDNVGTFGAVNSWLLNVELKGNYRRAIWGYGALWFTMQRCHVVGGVPIGADRDPAYDSNRSYGLFVGAMTASYFVDNILEKLTSGVAFEGPGSGNVFSYNFITDIWWTETGDSPRRFGPLMHGPTPS